MVPPVVNSARSRNVNSVCVEGGEGQDYLAQCGRPIRDMAAWTTEWW
jgi:hypothetical protein